MTGRGGPDRGQGRKPKAIKWERPINAAEKRIADRLPELIDALFQVALGIWIEEVDKEGERRVYQCPPDFRAAMYLVNRVMGLPAKEDEAERYQAIVDEVSRRVVEALSDVTPEIRESVVAQLKNR